MPTRRQFLKTAVAGGGTGFLLTAMPRAQLCPPGGIPPDLIVRPGPPTSPFMAPLTIMPVLQPVDPGDLDPLPNPRAHQRWKEFPPQKF